MLDRIFSTRFFQKYSWGLFFLSVFFAGTPAALRAEGSAVPNVVATIAPLGSIAKSVMKGLGEPAVLLPPLASPHEGALTLSQAQSLSKADVIFWVGPGLESYLEKPIKTLGVSARAISLMAAEGVALLPLRGPCCSHHAHSEHTHHDRSNHDEGAQECCDHGVEHSKHPIHEEASMDPHIWLCPKNSQAIALEMAQVLSVADPSHEMIYRSNAEKFVCSINKVFEKIQEDLRPIEDKPFLVMHDGYQYFEKAFHLKGYKDVILADHHGWGTSIKSLREILKNMSALKPACVLAEKSGQTRFPALVAGILKTRLVWASPMGDDYAILLKNLGQDFVHCLKDQG